tara:strand:+ start:289 stop:813 length:525 start_codon:yes stop_codon:yes gene_type:complete
MYKQKYFFKGRDLIKVRNFVFNVLITVIFSLVGILSFFVSPGFSLSWQDEEWLKPGCPKTASGNWTASNPSNIKLRSLSINNNQVIYTSQSGENQKFQIIKSTSDLKIPYVEMNLKSFNKEGKLVLKIRPHLIQTSSKEQKKGFNCLIKVFRYKNQKHAKAEKYSGWNIYKRTK